MELTATPEELADLLATPAHATGAGAGALRVYAEPRERTVRMFDAVPADWARGGEKTSLALDASVGEYVTFQIGVFAPTAAALSNFSVEFADLVSVEFASSGIGGGRVSVPASAFTCFNLGGVDYHGVTFDSTAHYAVAAGAVGSVWIGLDLPTDVSSAGVFIGHLTLSADAAGGGGRATVNVSLRVSVTLPADGRPLPDHGDGDIYGLSRLRWLDSTTGIDDTVPAPFTAPKLVAPRASTVAAHPAAVGGFAVELLSKRVTVGADGLPAQVSSCWYPASPSTSHFHTPCTRMRSHIDH
jgi:hypothetical protein